MPRSSLLFFICKMKRSPQSQFVFVIRHQFNFFRSNIWRAMRIDEEEFFAVISYAVFCLKKKKKIINLSHNKALTKKVHMLSLEDNSSTRTISVPLNVSLLFR